MDYAVIRSGGKQYRVSPGDIVRLEGDVVYAGAALREELADRRLVAERGQ